MLNLVRLRTFLALVEHKSFQTAAELLQIAQPTVSLHIQKLEEQLGARCFTDPGLVVSRHERLPIFCPTPKAYSALMIARLLRSQRNACGLVPVPTLASICCSLMSGPIFRGAIRLLSIW